MDKIPIKLERIVKIVSETAVETIMKYAYNLDIEVGTIISGGDFDYAVNGKRYSYRLTINESSKEDE